MSELIKPKIVTECEAERRIAEAVAEMDLDGLAKLFSDICDTDCPIVVVHEGCEATTAEEIGADETIPASSVYKDGEVIGDLASDGTIDGDAEEDSDEAKNQSDKAFGRTDDD